MITLRATLQLGRLNGGGSDGQSQPYWKHIIEVEERTSEITRVTSMCMHGDETS